MWCTLFDDCCRLMVVQMLFVGVCRLLIDVGCVLCVVFCVVCDKSNSLCVVC